jgi:hypothetical protein
VADHSRDRVEAAAEALFDARSNSDGSLWYQIIEPAREMWRPSAAAALAAADEADRVAGVVRLDRDALVIAERALGAMTMSKYRGDAEWLLLNLRAVRETLRTALGAAGVGERES